MTAKEKESYEWFKKQVKQYQKKTDEEYKKMQRRAILPGSFIMFKYKQPVGKGKKWLKFYDESPVDVILNIKGNDMWCINFHYIPRVFRKTVIAFIIKLNKQRIKQDKRFELTYQQIKEFLSRNGLIKICIKRYKINRITNLQYIKGSDIKYIAELPSEKFIIQDPNMTEADLFKLILSHSSSTKSSKNTRFGRSIK